MNISEIFTQHSLVLLKEIKKNVFLCEKNEEKVVLKTNIIFPNNKRKKAEKYLSFLHGLKLEHTIFPTYLPTANDENYVMLSYHEGTEPSWSEYDESPENWGGKGLTIPYLNRILRTFEDLESIDIKSLLDSETVSWNQKIHTSLQFTEPASTEPCEWYRSEIPNLPGIENLLNRMVERSLINNDFKEKTYHFIQENFENFYSKNLIVSNFDFYPRNLLETPTGKLLMVDWEHPGFEIKERMGMYLWMHMFGNQEFQKALFKYFKEHTQYDITRYRMGLLLSALENIDLWWNSKKCTKAFQRLVEYMLDYEKIIK